MVTAEREGEGIALHLVTCLGVHLILVTCF
jgi:hypothetical protein